MLGLSKAQAGKRRGRRQPLRSELSECTVYLMGNKEFNWYKIGISVSPSERLKDLESKLPFELKLLCVAPMLGSISVAKYVERAVHIKYAAHRVRYEWFHSINEADFLKDVAKIVKNKVAFKPVVNYLVQKVSSKSIQKGLNGR